MLKDSALALILSSLLRAAPQCLLLVDCNRRRLQCLCCGCFPPPKGEMQVRGHVTPPDFGSQVEIKAVQIGLFSFPVKICPAGYASS